MYKLKYNNKEFNVINEITFTKSSRQVTFNSLKVDFTDKSITDLPRKYQETQILDNDGNIVFTGYVNTFTLPKMKNEVEFRQLEIELISPMAMATHRTVDSIGTYNVKDLIKEIIEPLIDDGFNLKELNVGTNQITVNFINETVESALNTISNKLNIWWYIDENKNIYVNSIAYLFSKQPQLIFDENTTKIDGLIDLIPSIQATDYCNTVNFTNVRVYTESIASRFYDENEFGSTSLYKNDYYPITSQYELKKGDLIELEIPFVLKASDTNSKIISISCLNGSALQTKVEITENSDGTPKITIGDVIISDSESDDHEWILIRDTFFKNLITKIKYNGENTTLDTVKCANALPYAKVKIANEEEINKNKGLVTKTGIVEKIIDMSDTWRTYDELVSIANSYIKINSSEADKVVMGFDKDLNLDIGGLININKSNFLINGYYIITDIQVSINGYDNKYIKATMQNSNYLENYVDLFRAKEQENENKNYKLITSNYVENEIKEKIEVEVL